MVLGNPLIQVSLGHLAITSCHPHRTFAMLLVVTFVTTVEKVLSLVNTSLAWAAGGAWKRPFPNDLNDHAGTW